MYCCHLSGCSSSTRVEAAMCLTSIFARAGKDDAFSETSFMYLCIYLFIHLHPSVRNNLMWRLLGLRPVQTLINYSNCAAHDAIKRDFGTLSSYPSRCEDINPRWSSSLFNFGHRHLRSPNHYHLLKGVLGSHCSIRVTHLPPSWNWSHDFHHDRV